MQPGLAFDNHSVFTLTIRLKTNQTISMLILK